MTIIFDFNRTLYNPDTMTLMEGAMAMLRTLKELGHSLYLVSKREAGRTKALEELEISEFFTDICFVDTKEAAIEKIIREAADTTYVIGDYLHNEIRIGNRLGARTIWFQRGKFAHLTPETRHDIPWRTVQTLDDVPVLILG